MSITTSRTPVAARLKPASALPNQPALETGRPTPVTHVSFAGPGQWKTKNGNVELSFATGGLAALLKPEVVEAMHNNQQMTWIHSPATVEDFHHGDYHFPEDGHAEPNVFMLRPEDMEIDGRTPTNEEFKQILREEAYGKFCKDAIWMTLHGQTHNLTPAELRRGFESFKLTDKAFARKISHMIDAGTIASDGVIAFHDFQLFMAPMFLAEMRPATKMTGYWHVPMPKPSELFQSLSGRTDMGLPDDIAVEMLQAIANTPNVRWGTHSKLWAANFEACCDYAAQQYGVTIKRDTMYVNPGYLDPHRLQEQAFGSLNPDEYFGELKERTLNVLTSDSSRALLGTTDNFGQWESELLSSEAAMRDYLTEHAPSVLKELDQIHKGLATDDVYKLILDALPIDVMGQNGSVVKKHLSRDELDTIALSERGQIVTVVGRADPKNGMDGLLDALIEVQKDPSVKLKPSLLFVCAKNGDGVTKYEQLWTQLTGEYPANAERFDIEPGIQGKVAEFVALGGNILHMNGNKLNGVAFEVEPFALTLASHDLCDISVTPSRRGGRDLVALEKACLARPGTRSWVSICARGAAASETLRGAIVVDHIGPPPIPSPLHGETPSELRVRENKLAASHAQLVAKQLAGALKQAINMSSTERQLRTEAVLAAAEKEATHTWSSTLTAMARDAFTPQKAEPCARVQGPVLFASI